MFTELERWGSHYLLCWEILKEMNFRNLDLEQWTKQIYMKEIKYTTNIWLTKRWYISTMWLFIDSTNICILSCKFAWNLLILPIRDKINFDICHPIERTAEKKKKQLSVSVSFMLFKGEIPNCSAWLVRNLRIWALAF